jgi:hypothetical protein
MVTNLMDEALKKNHIDPVKIIYLFFSISRSKNLHTLQLKRVGNIEQAYRKAIHPFLFLLIIL